VEQGDQDAERRPPRPQALGLAGHPVVAVDQACQRQGHVQRVAKVVVEGVAGEVAGIAALEQRLEVVEAAPHGGEVRPRIAGTE